MTVAFVWHNDHHFRLNQDEDVYTFFEPELPSESIIGLPRAKTNDALKSSGERRPPSKLQNSKSSSKSSQNRSQRHLLNPEKKSNSINNGSQANGRRQSSEKISWSVLDLKGENYFSCTVGRTRSNARYMLGSSDDVVSFLKELAEGASSN